MGSDLIFYQFSRSKVERGDFSHFLSLYAADRLYFLNIARLKIVKVVQRHTVLLNLNGLANSPADFLLEPVK